MHNIKHNTAYSIHIDLLDNPFVDKWKSYIQDLAVRLPKIHWRFLLAGSKVNFAKDADVDSLLKLHEAFEFLHYFNLGEYEKELADLDFLIKNPKELRQRHLNIWHRHFTTQATEWYSKRMAVPYGLVEETFNTIHAINQHVHVLEIATYRHLNNIDIKKERFTHFINCTDSREFKIKDQLWSNYNSVQTFPDTFDPIGNNHHHSVWLGEDIQGKDQVKAWIEEDDLSAEDCTGNLFFTPNLILDPNYLYYTVMSNPDWQKQHEACGKPVNRWPIGDILNLESINWKTLHHAIIQSVELDGKTLWTSS